MNAFISFAATSTIFIASLASCRSIDSASDSSQTNSTIRDAESPPSEAAQDVWHEANGFDAYEEFEDSLTASLCKAAEKDDIAELDRLVEEGADVNAVGKHGVTPLLWSMMGDESKCRKSFVRLLEHGADPNATIAVEREFPFWWWYIEPYHGESVTSLCAGMKDSSFLIAALEHGGDPNYTDSWGRTPIFLAISERPRHLRLFRSMSDNVRILLEGGANPNHSSLGSGSPLLNTVQANFITTNGFRSDYETALVLLEHGAVWRLEDEKLSFIELEILDAVDNDVDDEHFMKVLEFMTNGGFDIEEARERREKWSDELLHEYHEAIIQHYGQ